MSNANFRTQSASSMASSQTYCVPNATLYIKKTIFYLMDSACIQISCYPLNLIVLESPMQQSRRGRFFLVYLFFYKWNALIYKHLCSICFKVLPCLVLFNPHPFLDSPICVTSRKVLFITSVLILLYFPASAQCSQALAQGASEFQIPLHRVKGGIRPRGY